MTMKTDIAELRAISQMHSEALAKNQIMFDAMVGAITAKQPDFGDVFCVSQFQVYSMYGGYKEVSNAVVEQGDLVVIEIQAGGTSSRGCIPNIATSGGESIEQELLGVKVNEAHRSKDGSCVIKVLKIARIPLEK